MDKDTEQMIREIHADIAEAKELIRQIKDEVLPIVQSLQSNPMLGMLLGK